MKFKNTASADISFQIEYVKYKVAQGASCEIPDRFAYAPKLMGLPLEPEADMPAPSPPPSPAELPDPSQPPLPFKKSK
jgi:hypothetical protein